MNFSKKNYELKKSNRNAVSKTLQLILTLVLISAFGNAQNGINYKVLIKDDLGNVIVNTLVDIKFQILESHTQVNVYEEIHSPTTDDNGIIIVNIGEGIIVSGVFEDINWGNDNHFLNVKIDSGSGFVNLGTVQFSAVPYALHAKKAANVKGLEPIDEGNGIGWRLVDRNADNYDNIGFNAIDLSFINDPNLGLGATGSYAFSLGLNGTASGEHALAFGNQNYSLNDYSIALGNNNTVSGLNSTAIGGINQVSGDYALAAGLQNEASENYAVAMGQNTTASGVNSIAMGINASASGTGSFASGYSTRATAWASTAMGIATEASGDHSTAIGSSTEASGDYSTALGFATKASGLRAIAMGYYSEASGDYSTTMGWRTRATSFYSIAMGALSEASGFGSTAMGSVTEASGNYSTAMGNETTASAYASLAIGRYNIGEGTPDSWINSDSLFEIGNGTSDSNRSNALTVRKNGQHIITSSSSGLTINADNIGVFINNPGSDGVIINNADDDGITINNPNDNGIEVTNAGNIGAIFEGTTAGVLATSTSTVNPDLILGDYSDNDTLGLLSSSPNVDNSRLMFRSNASVTFELDHDNDDFSSLFIVRQGNGSPILILNESGDLDVYGQLEIGDEIIEDGGNDVLAFDSSLVPTVDAGDRLGGPNRRWFDVYAANGMIQTSDRRSKTNISNLNYGLNEVLQMQPVSFNWKNKNNPDTKLGLIAQDLQALVPEVVQSHIWEKDEVSGELIKKELDRLGVYYSDLVPVLINAIKEQQEEIDVLKNKLKTFKTLNEKLKHYEKLEARISKLESSQ
ncbi:tail fiber domain-containing protein [Winogradskyella sp.]|uniref:tail fiber domain-containing protein n=1 Tax=Winogradskyella sp. TaxID=1883156 RepID=UPI0025EBBD38|nr:tail fiber domain-containing protein [Winogradskyella sp.]